MLAKRVALTMRSATADRRASGVRSSGHEHSGSNLERSLVEKKGDTDELSKQQ